MAMSQTFASLSTYMDRLGYIETHIQAAKPWPAAMLMPFMWFYIQDQFFFLFLFPEHI